MSWRKLFLVFMVLIVGCSAPQPTQPQIAPTTAATRVRVERATPTKAAAETRLPIVAATATAAASATVAPTATPAPTVSTSQSSGAAAPARIQATLVATGSVMAKSVPSLDSRKYPAPALLTPYDNAVYHVAQPVVTFTWTNTPDELMRFGQIAGCISDDTHFRKAFETNQILIRRPDAKQPDIVGWMDTGTDYTLNLTTLAPGRYSWSVNVGVVCESYVVGQRTATIERAYLGAVSPASAPRMFTWIP